MLHVLNLYTLYRSKMKGTPGAKPGIDGGIPEQAASCYYSVNNPRCLVCFVILNYLRISTWEMSLREIIFRVECDGWGSKISSFKMVCSTITCVYVYLCMQRRIYLYHRLYLYNKHIHIGLLQCIFCREIYIYICTNMYTYWQGRWDSVCLSPFLT